MDQQQQFPLNSTSKAKVNAALHTLVKSINRSKNIINSGFVNHKDFSEQLHLAQQRTLERSIREFPNQGSADVEGAAWNNDDGLEEKVIASLRQLENVASPEVRRKVLDLQAHLELLVDQGTARQIMIVLSLLARSGTDSSVLPTHSKPNVVPNPQASLVSTSRFLQNPKSEFLNRQHSMEDETRVLRECIYALQGLNGENLYLNDQGRFICKFSNDSCHDPEHVTLSKLGNGAHDALQSLCGYLGVGWYYRRLQAYIQRYGGIDNSLQEHHDSSIARAWAEALSTQLDKSYHSLLADLDAELQSHNQSDSSSLTLRQIMRRLQEPTHHLRTLAILVDGVEGLSGGPLLTALHRHTHHGDTRHTHLAQQMLKAASQPWYLALYLWTTQGILVASDFFIQREKSVAAFDHYSSIATADLWHSTFHVIPDLVPEILPSTLIQPCYSAGKGINFIRYCLHDSGWKMSLGEVDNEQALDQLGYRYDHDKRLAETIRQAKEQVDEHIVRSLKEKHHLLQHLRGLKQFLLLGQGDFFSVLMDGLHAEFDGKGIHSLYDYSLMGIIDAALKCTNAAGLPNYVLECLSVKLTNRTVDDARYRFDNVKAVDTEDARTGWDIFTLEYQIPEPIAAIVHEHAMSQYQSIFSLLFGLKRVEYMLNLTWRQSAALHHAIQTYAQRNAISTTTNPEYAQTRALLRHTSMVRQSMMHFVVNLKSYLFFEVLEGAWKVLSSQLEMSSLDDLIQAHDAYLADIVLKSLLVASIEGNASATHAEDPEIEALGLRLQHLLALALEFCTFQEQIFRSAIQQAELATEKLKEAERRSKQGNWGFVSEKDVNEAKTFFGLIDDWKLKSVISMGDDFNRNAKDFLTAVHQISHGTSASSTAFFPRSPSTNDSVSTLVLRDHFCHDSLNSLSFQLDYSSFYHVGDS